MDRHTVRYTFEHKLLPQMCFDDTAEFFIRLIRDKNFLFSVISYLFKREKVRNPYRAKQFSFEPVKLTDDVYLVIINFPAPEEEPLCYCSYLFWDHASDRVDYYCIEKAGGDDSEPPFICAWTQDGTHVNYGRCTPDDRNGLKKCVALFMGSRPEK